MLRTLPSIAAHRTGVLAFTSALGMLINLALGLLALAHSCTVFLISHCSSEIRSTGNSASFATAGDKIKVKNPVVDLDGDEMTRYG